MAKVAVAVLALLAMAAVATAQPGTITIGGGNGQPPKKVIIIPNAQLAANRQQGTPQPLRTPNFERNNIPVVKQPKPQKPPVVREAPVIDNTVPVKNNRKLPRTQFRPNNTVIPKPQKQIQPKAPREAPVIDNTRPFKNNQKLPRTQFLPNNTVIPKPQRQRQTVFIEKPIRDITTNPKNQWQGVKPVVRGL